MFNDASRATPVQHSPLWESALASLRMAIIRGELAPGAHLLEVQLAERLGVSRGPVREALLYLEKEGLVVNQPYRGKFVVDLSPAMIHETYTLRRLLECFAAELALVGLDAEHLVRLRELYNKMMQAVHQQHFDQFADIDLEFHRLLVLAAGHARLLQMWETLTGVTHAFIAVNASLDQEGYSAIAQGHEAILQALEQRDVAATQAALTFHLAEAERRLLQIMQDKPSSSVYG